MATKARGSRRSGRAVRGQRRSGRGAPRRGLLVPALLVACAAAVAAVPPITAAAARAADVFTAALHEARYAESRRERLAELASRYGISAELAREIEAAAVAEGIDPELGFRLVQVESGFRERAVSHAGAMGLTQLMPATAEWLLPGITREEIFDRRTNLRLGFRYLRMLLRTYGGDVDEALHAYNRGPGTVERIRAAGGDPANGYADRVLGARHGAEYTGSGLLPRPASSALHADR